MKRNYAVGIIEAKKLVKITETRLTLIEALVHARSYNRLNEARQAVVLLHPLSSAIFRASSRSVRHAFP